MLFDELIIQTHADSVVAKEKSTVATPVLENGVDQL